MKKSVFLLLLVAALALSGCARQNEESAAPEVVVPGSAAAQEQTDLPERIPLPEEEPSQEAPPVEEELEPAKDEAPAEEPPAEELPEEEVPERDPNDRSREQSIVCIYYLPSLRYQDRVYDSLTYVTKEDSIPVGELLGTDERYGNFYAVEGYDPRLILYVERSFEDITGELLISMYGNTFNPSPWEQFSLSENYTRVTVQREGESEIRILAPAEYPKLEQSLAALQQGSLRSFSYLCGYWNVQYPQDFDEYSITLTLKNGMLLPLTVMDREFVRIGRSFCVQLPEETHAALLELAGKGKNK